MSYKTEKFQCPQCGGRLYRSSRRGKQVYKCNDLRETGVDCELGRQAVGRTKAQVKQLVEMPDFKVREN